VGSHDLQAAVERLGEPVEVFRCINALLLLGALFGLLVLAGAIALTAALIYFIARDGFEFRMIQGAVLPVVAGFGWLTARNCLGRMGSRVLLCERGFIYHHRHGVTVFPWAEITQVANDDATATPGRSGFPRVRKATEFTVFRADGATFVFSLYTVRRHLKLARAIFDATQMRGAKWV
jgi:hypothetical protein